MKLSLKIALLIIFISGTANAQFLRDSLSFVLSNYQNKRLYSTFDKQLNTYNLNTGFTYNLSGDKFYFGIDEKFNSSIIKSNDISIKDDQQVSMIGEYIFREDIKTGVLFSHSLFSDDRDLDINEASSVLTSVYAKYEPLPQLKFIPFAGYSQNKQISETDNGMLYGAEALLDNLSTDDFNIYSSLKFQNEDILPRRNLLRNFNVAAINVFEDNFINTISGGYSELRKDFYFEADSLTRDIFDINSNIQSRTEKNYLIEDLITFNKPGSAFSMEFGGKFGWRDVNRNTRYLNAQNVNASNLNTRIREFRIELSAGAGYSTRNFRSKIKLAFNEHEEKHFVEDIENLSEIYFSEREELEARKNNTSQITNLILSADYNITDRDNISFSLFHRKLVYNTPSEDNNDDRDELLSIFRAGYTRKLSSLFTYFLNFEGSINHLVYILAERSSNNNIRRIVKLGSGGEYSSDIFKTRLEAEVSANYTVYDFEDLQPNFQSYSFRQYTLRDSSSLKLNDRLRLDVNGYMKFSEQGEFDWNEFSGNPQRLLHEYYIEPKIFTIFGKLNIGTGFRYFNLTTFDYETASVRNKASEYNSIGPIADIFWHINGRLVFKVYGWYEFIRPEDGKQRENVNLNIKLNWNIL